MKKLTNAELGRKSPEEFRSSGKLPIVIVLDNVRSGYNVGSVFRTADAFLAEAIYLCGITCHPPHKEILKTSLGAEKTVSWKYFKTTIEAIREIKRTGYKVYAVEQTENSLMLDEVITSPLRPSPPRLREALWRSKGGEGLVALDFFGGERQPIALVFGHEVEGVQQEIIDVCDGSFEIPQGGTKHSLNIAVSAGVVLWEFFRKRKPL